MRWPARRSGTTGGKGSFSATAADKSDDMLDSDVEINRLDPRLQKALLDCQTIFAVFEKADSEAAQSQSEYNSYASLAAKNGTAAVVLAVLLCAFHDNFRNWQIPLSLLLIEVAAAGLALWAVLMGGLFRNVKYAWLRQRNKAERCRLLKFAFLIYPQGWATGVTCIGTDVSTALSNIENDSPGLETWMREEPPPPEIPTLSFEEFGDRLVTDIVEYYCKGRLEKQKRFFKRRAEEYNDANSTKRHIPELCFYVSICCVFIHSTLALALVASPETTIIEPIGMLFLIFAIGLPALAAGIRTMLMSREFARNSSRYSAKLHALDELTGRLNRAKQGLTGSGNKSLYRETLFRDLAFCEHVLESDHREWTRLMMEAEWF